MLKFSQYVKNVLNEADEADMEVTDTDGAEGAEPKEPKKPKPAEKECDTILTIECCGTTLKKIIDAIKKTEGEFKVEIDTGNEEDELKIEWTEDDMIGTVTSEKKDKEAEAE